MSEIKINIGEKVQEEAAMTLQWTDSDKGVTDDVEVSWQELSEAEPGDMFNDMNDIRNGSFSRATVVYTNDYVSIVLEEHVKVVDGNKIIDMENACPTIIPYEFR